MAEVLCVLYDDPVLRRLKPFDVKLHKAAISQAMPVMCGSRNPRRRITPGERCLITV